MTKTSLGPGISRVVYAEKMNSTQTRARRLADAGAPSGTLVWARRQSAGRGRMERTWDSPLGGLYFSIVLRPDFKPALLAQVSLAAADSVARAILKVSRVKTKIQLPNDVYARESGHWKKLSGILTEAAGHEKAISWLIVGIGVNVNNSATLETATSLRAITKKTWDLKTLLTQILADFDAAYSLLGKT